jgi:hypothetical protein
MRFGKSSAKSLIVRRGYRPRLELLEDRLTPSAFGPVDSLTPLAPAAVQARPASGFRHIDFKAESTVADGIFPNTLNSATYITGAPGTATASGTTIDSAGNTYTTGTITDLSGSKQGYVTKYNSAMQQQYLFTYQAVDNTAPTITFVNTEGHAIAVDAVGNVYVAGTAVDASSGDHNAYTLKINALGTAIIWGNALDGPGNVTTGDGIAVKDPNSDGNGFAVLVGTLNLPATIPPPDNPGDNLYIARWNVAGDDVVAGDHIGGVGYYFYWIFSGTPGAINTHASAVALNNTSTATTPGGIGYIAGNIVDSMGTGDQNELAFSFTNDVNQQQGGRFALLFRNVGSSTDSLTGVAANPDDSSVYSGTINFMGTGPVEGTVAGLDTAGNLNFAGADANATALNSVTVDSAGNIFAAGASATGAYVAEIDSTGMTLLGDMSFGAAGDVANGVIAASSGTVWVVGNTTSSTLATDGTTLMGAQDGFLASVTLP